MDIPSSVAFLVVKRDYLIISANQQCHLLFGYDDNELIGKHIEILISPKSREVHHQEAEKYWGNIHPRQLGVGRDIYGLKKDGKFILVEIGLYPYEENILAIIIDISTRNNKNMVEEFKNLLENLEKISNKL